MTSPNWSLIGILMLAGTLLPGCSDRTTAASTNSTKPSSSSVQIVFSAEEPAELWINGAKVGPLPQRFDPRDLQPYFLPEFERDVHSLDAMDAAKEAAQRTAEGAFSGGKSSAMDCQVTTWKRGQDEDDVVLVRATVRAVPFFTVAGGFRLRVTAADGTQLESHGGSSSTVGDASTIERRFARPASR